jgi:hypothetical protein
LRVPLRLRDSGLRDAKIQNLYFLIDGDAGHSAG